MRARKSSEALKFILTLSIMGNVAAGGYWLWLQKTPAKAQAVDTGDAAAHGLPQKAPARAEAVAPPAAAQAPLSPSARPRPDGKPYAYWLKIRSLDAKAVADAPSAEDSPESLQGPPPGTPRTMLALPDAPAQAGGPVHVTQQAVAPDTAVRSGPEFLRSGCCRIVFMLDADAGGNRPTVVTPVTGTYHESCEAVADARWENDRLPLWRYQTADGHGGRFHYEVYVERKAKG
jgi:hypothetical protein